MSMAPREKKIIVIGDSSICLIGVAAGTDYFVFRNDCKELHEFLRENSEEYGVFIVSRNIVNKCKEVNDFLNTLKALTVIIDPPKVMKEIDPKKYYEELVTRFVGMKVSLG